MVFDQFNTKKLIAPLTEAAVENKAALYALTTQAVSQSEQLARFSEQSLRAHKELSLQIEELYDRVTDPAPVVDPDTEQLVGAAVCLRDELEHLRTYAFAKSDEELNRQIGLLLLICDRKLFQAGISRIERLGEIYDPALDAVSDVEYAPALESGVITKVLSGCYKYRGATVRRATVIVNKGEKHE